MPKKIVSQISTFADEYLPFLLFFGLLYLFHLWWKNYYTKSKLGKYLDKHFFEKYLYLKYPCCGNYMGFMASIFCGTGWFSRGYPTHGGIRPIYHKCHTCKKVYQLSALFCFVKFVSIFICIFNVAKLFKTINKAVLFVDGHEIITFFLGDEIMNLFCCLLVSFVLFVLFCFIIHRLKWYMDVWDDEGEKIDNTEN